MALLGLAILISIIVYKCKKDYVGAGKAFSGVLIGWGIFIGLGLLALVLAEIPGFTTVFPMIILPILLIVSIIGLCYNLKK